MKNTKKLLPTEQPFLEWDYETSGDWVFHETIKQVNRALKQKGIKVDITYDEMFFDNENKWDGFICDDHKETHKKILELQSILEDPASYEDDDFDEDEILEQITDLECDILNCDKCVVSQEGLKLIEVKETK